METIKRDNTKYTLRSLDEVTNGACKRVETLQDRLLFRVLDYTKMMPTTVGITKENIADTDIQTLATQKGLFRKDKTMADLIDAMRFDNYKKELMAVMLMTDLDYFELTSDLFSRKTQLWLIEEAKVRIGTYEGFINGLQLSMNSLQATTKHDIVNAKSTKK